MASQEEQFVGDVWDDDDFNDIPASVCEGSVYDGDESIPVTSAPCSIVDGHQDIQFRGALSVIPEESRMESDFGNVPSSRPASRPVSSHSFQDGFGESDQFMTGAAALDFLKMSEEKFVEETPFIQEDYRFNRSHFSKENSWEPSVLNITTPTKDSSASSHRSSLNAIVSSPVARPPPPQQQQPAHTTPPLAPLVQPQPPPNMIANNRVAQLRDKFQSATTSQSQSSPLSITNFNSPSSSESMMINKKMSTPQAYIEGKRPSRVSLQKSLEAQFSDVSAITTTQSHDVFPRVLNFDDHSPPSNNGNQREKNVVVSSRSRTQMRDNGERGNETTMDSEPPSFDVRQMREMLKAIPSNAEDTDMLNYLSTIKRERHQRIKPNFVASVQQSVQHQPQRRGEENVEVTGNNYGSGSQMRTNDTSSSHRVPFVSMENSRPQDGSQHQQQRPTTKHIYPSTMRRPEVNTSRPSSSSSSMSSYPASHSLHPPYSRPGSESSLRPVSQASTVTSQTGSMRSTSGSVLEATCRHVYFGCVEVGESVVQRYTLTNTSADELSLMCSLRKENVGYKIVSNGGTLVLRGGETVSVSIEFTPTEVARYGNKLKIYSRHLGKEMGYGIPLIGSGGVSALSILPAPSMAVRKDGSFALKAADPTRVTLTVQNNGKRNAFVRVILQDREGGPLKFIADPSDSFVLKRGASEHLSIRLLSPLPHSMEYDLGGSRSSLASSSTSHHPNGGGHLATLRLGWGEEIARERFKLICESRKCAAVVDGVDYGVPFMGQGPPYEPPKDYPLAGPDLNVFQRGLRFHTVYISASGSHHSRSSFHHGDLTMDGQRMLLEPSDTTMNTTVGMGRTLIYDGDVTVTPKANVRGTVVGRRGV